MPSTQNNFFAGHRSLGKNTISNLNTSYIKQAQNKYYFNFILIESEDYLKNVLRAHYFLKRCEIYLTEKFSSFNIQEQHFEYI